MSRSWIITSKPSFHTEWLLVPEQDNQAVLTKIALLAQDPRPDGVFKKQLSYLQGTLHSIRAKAYTIFYTFERPHLTLLALRLRKQSMDDIVFDDLFLDKIFDVDGEAAPVQEIDWYDIITRQARSSQPLPKQISVSLLKSLHVPSEYHTRFLSMRTQEELLNCPGIPYYFLQMIEKALWKQPIAEIAQQPYHVIAQVSDLQRYKDGDLHEFLLRLAPEQERAARRALDAGGPTQVKGRPGTGKSTVALYRVQYLLKQLSSTEQSKPQILFTTYTKALVEASRSLLKQLLGTNIENVKICTADSLINSIFNGSPRPNIAEPGTLSKFIKDAVENVLPEERTRQHFLNKLSYDYLVEEILQVILARQVISLDQYLKFDRQGRKVRLIERDRTTVWHIHQKLQKLLQAQNQETWQQARLRAEDFLTTHSHFSLYDAVVVDEAQDLDPSVLRILVKLCRAPNRFFITADANQSIYRAGFSWKDVDASLNFQGRTTVLTTNYRSVQEIAEAAHSYLTMGATDTDTEEALTHMLHGSQPAVCMTQNSEQEHQSLANFLFNAMETLHIGRNMCAVLCPTKRDGEIIAAALKTHKIPARFLSKDQVNLSCSEVKVLTLHSSKGLEFPIVALAGFRGSRYAQTYDDLSEDEKAETLFKDRRVLFVGMTRAMRMLLVLIPTEATSLTLTGFDSAYWDNKATRSLISEYR